VQLGVLTNDGQGVAPATVTSHTDPAHGIVSCDATTCTYTPNSGFWGTDTFSYTITDAVAQTSVATMSIDVAAPLPHAVDDAAQTTATTPTTVAVLDNDQQGAGPANVTAHTDGAHGAVSCDAATCTYTGNDAFVGDDTFTYTITDELGQTSTAMVTVTRTAPDPGTTSGTGGSVGVDPVTPPAQPSDPGPSNDGGTQPTDTTEEVHASHGDRELAFTGAPIGALTVAGQLLLALGIVLTAARRRRPTR